MSLVREVEAVRWYLTQSSVRGRLDACMTCEVRRDVAGTVAVRATRRDAKRLPKQARPAALEARYRRDLRKRVDDIHELTTKRMAAELRKVGPGIDERARRDNAAEDIRKLLRVITSVERAVAKSSPVDEAAVTKLGEQLALFTTRAVDRQLSTVIAIDVTANLATTAELIEAWTAANVELITSIDARYFDELRDAVTSTVREGQSTKSLTDAIAERYGVSQSRAELIAVDQVGTLNGQITQARQVALGIEEFTWSTSRDGRVRPEHEALEGEVFRWDEGGHPVEGIPGQSIRCRCGAIARL